MLLIGLLCGVMCNFDEKITLNSASRSLMVQMNQSQKYLAKNLTSKFIFFGPTTVPSYLSTYMELLFKSTTRFIVSALRHSW